MSEQAEAVNQNRRWTSWAFFACVMAWALVQLSPLPYQRSWDAGLAGDVRAAAASFSAPAALHNLGVLLLYVLVDLLVFLNGWALCRLARVPLGGWRTTLVYGHCIGYAGFFLLFTLYGLAGFYHPAVAWATMGIALATAGTFVLRHGRALVRQCPPWRRREAFTVARALNVLVLALTVLLLGYLLLVCFRPPQGWDEVAYNLWLPKVYVERNGLPYVEEYNFYSAFPQYAEMGSVAGILLGSAYKLPHLFGWGETVLCALALSMLARRFGLRSRWQALLSLSLVMTPQVLSLTPECKNDVVAALFQIVALDGILRWQRRPRSGFLVLAGICAGVSLGAKYTAVYVVALLLGLLAALAWGRERRLHDVLRALLLFGVTSLVMFSPWLVRNCLTTGNPVFPALAGLLGGGGRFEFTGEYQQALADLSRQYGFRLDRDLGQVRREVRQDLGPWIYMWLLPYGCLYARDVWRRRLRQHMLALLALLSFTVWLFGQMLWIRYTYLSYALGLIAATLALERLVRSDMLRRVAVVGLAGVVAAAALVYVRSRHAGVLELVVSAVDVEAYGRDHTTYGQQVAWMNTHLPPHARIYTMLNQNYYARQSYVAMHALTEYGGFLTAQSADEYYRRLSESGIEFVAYARASARDDVAGELLDAFTRRIADFSEALRLDGRLRPVAALGKPSRMIEVCRVVRREPLVLTIGELPQELQAEDFARGNAQVNYDYAPQLGVVRSKRRQASTTIEFDVEALAPGRYHLQLCLASDAPRPVAVSLDSRALGESALQATGGLGVESLRWDAALPVAMEKGRHVLRIERAGPFPHIDRLRLARDSAQSASGPCGDVAGPLTPRER